MHMVVLINLLVVAHTFPLDPGMLDLTATYRRTRDGVGPAHASFPFVRMHLPTYSAALS
jgi:hypothetical protein